MGQQWLGLPNQTFSAIVDLGSTPLIPIDHLRQTVGIMSSWTLCPWEKISTLLIRLTVSLPKKDLLVKILLEPHLVKESLLIPLQISIGPLITTGIPIQMNLLTAPLLLGRNQSNSATQWILSPQSTAPRAS